MKMTDWTEETKTRYMTIERIKDMVADVMGDQYDVLRGPQGGYHRVVDQSKRTILKAKSFVALAEQVLDFQTAPTNDRPVRDINAFDKWKEAREKAEAIINEATTFIDKETGGRAEIRAERQGDKIHLHLDIIGI